MFIFVLSTFQSIYRYFILIESTFFPNRNLFRIWKYQIRCNTVVHFVELQLFEYDRNRYVESKISRIKNVFTGHCKPYIAFMIPERDMKSKF